MLEDDVMICGFERSCRN